LSKPFPGADRTCRNGIGRLRARLRTLIKLWTIALLIVSNLVASQELVMANPYQIKAAFLRNFAHYVIWPNNVFPDGSSPWHIGILGEDPFGDVLEMTLNGRTEQGRPFEIFRADRLDKLPNCQIIFIAYKEVADRRSVLVALKSKPVLTVSDAPEFLQEGGIIRFQVKDRVQMSINLDQARAVSLAIQTKMLEVSSDILENGVASQMR
jgi:hypothetical protein